MNVINYQKELDKTIVSLQKEGRVPKLLLHSCCAPCSSYVLEYLSEYFEITVFYYNPNIYPESETNSGAAGADIPYESEASGQFSGGKL